MGKGRCYIIYSEAIFWVIIMFWHIVYNFIFLLEDVINLGYIVCHGYWRWWDQETTSIMVWDKKFPYMCIVIILWYNNFRRLLWMTPSFELPCAEILHSSWWIMNRYSWVGSPWILGSTCVRTHDLDFFHTMDSYY